MGDRATERRLREILTWVFDHDGVPEAAVLLQQARTATIRSGPVTMLELDTASEAPPVLGRHQPWPVTIDVIGSDGSPAGGILLWVEDGRLATFEYFWYMDQRPSELPSIAQLAIED